MTMSQSRTSVVIKWEINESHCWFRVVCKSLYCNWIIKSQFHSTQQSIRQHISFSQLFCPLIYVYCARIICKSNGHENDGPFMLQLMVRSYFPLAKWQRDVKYLHSEKMIILFYSWVKWICECVREKRKMWKRWRLVLKNAAVLHATMCASL